MRGTAGLSITLASCLTTLLWTGPAAASGHAPGAAESAAGNVKCNAGAQSVLVLTEIGEDQYLSYQRVLLDAPISEVWPEIRDMERFAEVVLPDVAPTFMWVDGGAPEIIPSRYQFTAEGTTLLEEIIYRSEQEHQILIRLVEPAVGMQQYYAFGDLTQVCGNKTLLQYTRYLDLAPATDPEFFRSLFTQEFIDIAAYFND